MNCDEFRERWLADDGVTSDEEHRDRCAGCAAWVEGQRLLDDALASALLIAPPPELSARLAMIPAPVARPAVETAGQRFFDVVFVPVAALGAIGLSGTIIALVLGIVGPFAADAFQAILLILNSPLVGYYQSVASTLLGALATLVLVALVLFQMRTGTVASSERRPL